MVLLYAVPMVEVHLLGRFRVRRDNAEVPLSDQAKRLLAFLCCHYEHPVDRLLISKQLDLSAENSRGLLLDLRKALKEDGEVLLPLFADPIQINTAVAQIDLIRFNTQLRSAGPDAPQGAENFLRAATLFQSPLLVEGWTNISEERWIRELRDEINDGFWQAYDPSNLKDIASSLRAPALIAPFIRLLAQPSSKQAGQLRLPGRAFCDYLAALSRKRRFRLINQANVRLKEAAREANGKISRTITSTFEQLQHLQNSQRLDDPLFLGFYRRSADLVPQDANVAKVIELVADYRVVTLLGPPGLGKSTLAELVGESLRGEVEHGVWFVDLEQSVPEPRGEVEIAGTIAAILRQTFEVNILPRLIQFIGQQQRLLILDGCETVLPALSAVVNALLNGCPNLRILATSRELLSARGEKLHSLLKWQLPAPGTYDWKVLYSFSAAKLFLKTAERNDLRTSEQSQQKIQLTEENARLSIEILQLTEGIPLAIELAASSLAHLTLQQVRDDLRNLHFGQSQEERLTKLISRTYSRLAPVDQIVFRRLAVFVGGVVEEHAIEVCSDDVVIGEQVPVALRRLTSASLIEPLGGRYTMLNLTRTFALRELYRHEDFDRTSSAHCRCFCRFASKVGNEVFGPNIVKTLSRVDQDLPNIRRALEWSFEQSCQQGLDLAGWIWPYWVVKGYVGEGRRVLVRLWRRSKPADPFTLARCLVGRGVLAYYQSSYHKCITYCQQGAILANSLDKPWLEESALAAAGVARFVKGDILNAIEDFNRSLAIAQRTENVWLLSLAFGNIALYRALLIAQSENNPSSETVQEVVLLGEKAIQYGTESQNDWVLSIAIVDQGIVLRSLGRDPEGTLAESLFRSAFKLRYGMGDRYGMIQMTLLLASSAYSRQTKEQIRRAAILLGGQSTLFGRGDQIPVPEINLQEYKTVLEGTRNYLGVSQFDKHFKGGATLSLSELAAFAMSERTTVEHDFVESKPVPAERLSKKRGRSAKSANATE